MSRRYRLAFLETICRNKSVRNRGSYRVTREHSTKARSTRMSHREHIRCAGDHRCIAHRNLQQECCVSSPNRTPDKTHHVAELVHHGLMTNERRSSLLKCNCRRQSNGHDSAGLIYVPIREHFRQEKNIRPMAVSVNAGKECSRTHITNLDQNIITNHTSRQHWDYV